MQDQADPASAATEIEIGDTVRLNTPYIPTPTGPKDTVGTFTHGIVVEIVTRHGGRESAPRSVSLNLFNPRTRSFYVQSGLHGAIPTHVDKPADALTLAHKATEPYENRDPEADAEGFIESLPADEIALWDRLQPLLGELHSRGFIDEMYFIPGDGVTRSPTVMLRAEESEYVDLALDTARRIGWAVKDQSDYDTHTAYTLTVPSNAELIGEDGESQ